MVDGNTGGDGGLHLVAVVCQVLDIDVGGHGGLGDDGIQHIVGAADVVGHLLGEQVVGKAVEEADDHQNQSIGHHDGLVAQLVDDPPDQGCRKETGDGGNGKQQADHGSIGAVEQDQHIGAEGEEHLLAGTVEHFQHVVFGILLVEIEAALVLVGLAFTLDTEGKNHAHRRQGCGHGEEELVNSLAGADGKGGHDHQIASQSTDLVAGGLGTQGFAAPALLGIA